MKYSLVVPVYRNEASLAEVLAAIMGIAQALDGALEAVFVVDGSPDASHEVLTAALPQVPYASQLLLLSRNFGAFAAIREGLRHARGEYCAVMAADLQEPPDLIVTFFRELAADAADVIVGAREARVDPWRDRLASALFWSLYRRFVQPEIPKGGIDVFGCNRRFRDNLLALESVATSLVGQLVWLGFRRKVVSYTRLQRRHGRSAWSLGRKLNYLMDSVFAFSDLPIRALLYSGVAGMAVSGVIGALVLIAKLTGALAVPGYAATVLLIVFFAALNLLGLGIVGSYAYRAFEHGKRRPAAIVMQHCQFPGGSAP